VSRLVVNLFDSRKEITAFDVAWDLCSQPDGNFLDDASFEKLFGGDALIGITGGASGMLEPIMLRSTAKRDTFAWKRGETTATATQLMELNGITATALTQRALELVQ